MSSAEDWIDDELLEDGQSPAEFMRSQSYSNSSTDSDDMKQCPDCESVRLTLRGGKWSSIYDEQFYRCRNCNAEYSAQEVSNG